MDPLQGPPQPDLLIGQTIGNYLVTQKLGEGGMGSVYLAEHPGIGKKVALKVLHSEFSSNREVTERFFNEAKAVNNIGHPNIVDIVDYGVIQAGAGREQLVYFIMEYLAGATLSQLVRTESPLPPERALSIAMQVADALSASHRCGIVHRDLKPDNIILVSRGRERDFVKLLDFGIAKLTGDVRGSSRTRTGIVMGTPAYMSPEQCEGRGNVDLRTDIYALGIVMYEMLTGRVPFIGEGYGEILVQHLTRPPEPPSQYRMINPHVEVVVLKALEKRADLRYPTMDEFMRAMADPVGFVEAHGGIHQFMQRTLMPSSAPLPPIRLTPPPFTPVPGTLMPPSQGYATPAPTTLGTATGEVTPKRSKAGFIIAGLIVVAAAGAGIAVVLSGKEVPGGGSATPGSDPIASKPVVTPPAAPDAAEKTVEHAVVTPDAAPVAVAVPIDAALAVVAEPTSSKIAINSKPQGAEIFVNGADQHVKTPAPIEILRDKKTVTITLKLDKYVDYPLKNFSVANDANTIEYVLTKKPIGVITNRGSNVGSGKGSGKGSSTRPDDTRLLKPDDL